MSLGTISASLVLEWFKVRIGMDCPEIGKLVLVASIFNFKELINFQPHQIVIIFIKI